MLSHILFNCLQTKCGRGQISRAYTYGVSVAKFIANQFWRRLTAVYYRPVACILYVRSLSGRFSTKSC
jgi:hypothetical protein